MGLGVVKGLGLRILRESGYARFRVWGLWFTGYVVLSDFVVPFWNPSLQILSWGRKAPVPGDFLGLLKAFLLFRRSAAHFSSAPFCSGPVRI